MLTVLVCSDFETFYNPVHGNCYVFNSGWNSSKPLFWSRISGLKYGKTITKNDSLFNDLISNY